MEVSELNLKIFGIIDSMEKKQLEEFYGILVNFINEKRDLSDWQELTEEQQKGILYAIEEIDSGKGIAHAKVMENIRKKFKHV